MGQRFFDPDIWKKPWFRKLKPIEKAGVFFMFAACDNVGVWEPDMEMAELMIGTRVDWDAIALAMHGDLERLDERRVWLRDFCRFQYKNIEADNNACKSYRYLATKHGILEKIRETYITNPSSTLALPLVKGSMEGLENNGGDNGKSEGLVKGSARVGEGLGKAWSRVGEGLVKGTSRVQEQEQEQEQDSSLSLSLSLSKSKDNSEDVGEEEVEPSSPASSGLDRGWMKEVVGRLNEKAGTAFKADTDQTVRFLKARAAEGFVVGDFLLVIDFKVGQWRADPEMAQYLRPSTLFSPKFEGYLQAARNAVVEEEHAQQKREEQRRPTGNQAAPRSW